MTGSNFSLSWLYLFIDLFPYAIVMTPPQHDISRTYRTEKELYK